MKSTDLSAPPAATVSDPVVDVNANLPSSSPEKDSPPLTWAERAFGGSCSLKKCGSSFLLDSGELCVKISYKEIEDSKPLWKSFVVGQFYRKAPSFGKIRAIVNLIWSKWHHDISVTKLDTPNTFLFKIPNVSTRQRVLTEGIWSIDGLTMFVAEWTPCVTPSKPALKTVPVWIELRNVPFEFYNPPSLSRIASLVGHPICLHKETVQMTNFEVAKVFTEIDLLKPLPETVCAQFESGETRKISVSCPHLPPVCSLCAEPGHSSKHCSSVPPLCVICKKAYHSAEICPWKKGKEKLYEQSSEVSDPVGLTKPKNKQWAKKVTTVASSSVASTSAAPLSKAIIPYASPTASSSKEVIITEVTEEDSQKQFIELAEIKPPDDDNGGFTPVISKKQKKKNRAKLSNGPIHVGRFSFRH